MKPSCRWPAVSVPNILRTPERPSGISRFEYRLYGWNRATWCLGRISAAAVIAVFIISVDCVRSPAVPKTLLTDPAVDRRTEGARLTRPTVYLGTDLCPDEDSGHG